MILNPYFSLTPGSGGGSSATTYDIIATYNDDGSQDLRILEAGGSGAYTIDATYNDDGTQNLSIAASEHAPAAQDKTVNITGAGDYVIYPDSDYVYLNSVTLHITAGNYNVTAVENADGTQTLNITDVVAPTTDTDTTDEE